MAVNSLRDSRPLADKKLHALLARQFFLHGQYLAHTISPPSSGFNHLTGESAGLALLGEFLPGIPQASQWRIEGLAFLQGEGHQWIINPDLEAAGIDVTMRESDCENAKLQLERMISSSL